MATETNKRYTEEELSKMRDESTAFHKKQIPHLKVICEYEELKARIETARLNTAIAKVKTAQLLAGPESENQKNNEK
jgi:hypothetical protein